MVAASAQELEKRISRAAGGMGVGALALALAALGGTAHAARFESAGFASDLAVFAESWDSGVLEDGGPGEATHWSAACGSVSDSDISGGALALRGPDPACGGVIAATTFGTPGPQRLRASFAWGLPALGQSFGVSLSNPSATDLFALAVSRMDLSAAGLGSDVLLVASTAEPSVPGGFPTPLRLRFLSLNTPDDEAALSQFAAIEFELETVPGPTGTLVANGRVRLCQQADPCESEVTTPFQDLPVPAFPPPPPALVPLSTQESHGAGFVALGPAPFEVRLLDLAFEARGYGDDFEDGAFGATLPYLFFCGSAADVNEADGALALSRGDADCGLLHGVQLGFAAAFPGPQTFDAVLVYEAPPLCNTVGTAIGSLPTAGFGLETVALAVVRFAASPDTLTLLGTSEAEPGGAALPVFARADLPLGDVAGSALVDLRVELVEDAGPGLRPELAYRFCPAAPCPDEGTLPFTALPPVPGPLASAGGAPDPCPGLPASALAPPADGGRLTSPEPLGATLFALPEPGAAGAAAAGLLALVALGVRPQGRRP